MSYILEALRKADAQRERTRVPGLHAHPLAAEAPVPAQRWGGSVMAALAAVGVVAAIAVTWRLATPGAAPAVAAPERVDAAPAVTRESAPATPVAATPAPPEPATAIVPAAAPPLPPQPAREAKAAAAAAPAPITVPPASAMPAAAAAAAIAGAPPPGLPQLAVSGGVYSQNPAQRMLIVNGGVFNEGSEVARGVRLEEVRADKKAVLNFNGQRFALPY